MTLSYEITVPAPARPRDERLDERVRRTVTAMRRALVDGTLHHHGLPGVPAARRAPGLEVVRAWAAGADLDAQRRACRTCAARD